MANLRYLKKFGVNMKFGIRNGQLSTVTLKTQRQLAMVTAFTLKESKYSLHRVSRITSADNLVRRTRLYDLSITSQFPRVSKNGGVGFTNGGIQEFRSPNAY
jgi:hypothetical protein